LFHDLSRKTLESSILHDNSVLLWCIVFLMVHDLVEHVVPLLLLPIDGNDIGGPLFIPFSVSIELWFLGWLGLFEPKVIIWHDCSLFLEPRLSQWGYDLRNLKNQVVLGSCLLYHAHFTLVDLKSLINLLDLIALLWHVQELSPNLGDSFKFAFRLVKADGNLPLGTERLADLRLIEEI